MRTSLSNFSFAIVMIVVCGILVFCSLSYAKSAAEERCNRLGATPVSTDGKGTYICIKPDGRIVNE